MSSESGKGIGMVDCQEKKINENKHLENGFHFLKFQKTF